MLINTIIITGASGVGKTSISRLLCRLTGISYVNSGDLLRNHLKERNIHFDSEAETGSIFVNELGEEAVGQLIAKQALSTGVCTIDGMRLYSSYEILAKQTINPRIIHITAPEEIRIDRFVARSLADGSATRRTDAERNLCQKDRWNSDLDQFRQSAWRCFDNGGSWRKLKEFAADVAKMTR